MVEVRGHRREGVEFAVEVCDLGSRLTKLFAELGDRLVPGDLAGGTEDGSGGRARFAPCPPHIAPDPALRAVWTRERHNVFHWLHKADHQPYYGALKPLLEDHAKQLAKAIDRSGSSTLPVPAARTTLASSP